MRAWKFASVLLLASTAVFAQQAPGAANVTKAPISFDKAAMDTTANPCEDFFQYSCGGWRKANPIPADKARYGRFDQLREYNLNVLHGILEDVTKKKAKAGSVEQRVGDFYASCMDEKAVNALGAKPIQADLDAIAKIADKKQLINEIAYLHNRGINAGFGFGVGPDLHDSTRNIANIDQGGLSLADRDYYVSETPKMKETREKYVEHVANMFKLLGEAPEQAATDAKTVMAVETKLAQASMDRVSRRDPKNRDHKMKLAELTQIVPNFDLATYLKATGVDNFDELNVGNPDFFKQLNAYVDNVPLNDWKTYLRWRVLRSSASVLSDPFVNESFEFNGKYLSGQKELEARWKRCSLLADANLGELLGQLYVAKAFPPSAKQRMDGLTAAIETSMDADIKTLEWMSPETQKAAKEKLGKFTKKVGYPTKWRGYEGVTISRSDLLGNVRSASMYEVKRNYRKLGKPVDKSEWGMTPPTVNAYYSPAHNNINFPAGILQPPFFSNSIDDAVNYGGIGVVIGHELTHGFDDQGRKFDGEGNLRDWWGPTDGKAFEERANCIVEQYGNFSPTEGVKLNGKLTLGENTADNGGLKLAYMALMRQLGEDGLNKKVEGFTNAQRFFIGFGQVWCENVTPERARELALTDPHSAGKFRVIGTVQNSMEFRKAFNCKAGDSMAPQNACRVW